MARIVMAMDETQAGIIASALTKALRAERSELAIARLRSAQGPAAEGVPGARHPPRGGPADAGWLPWDGSGGSRGPHPCRTAGDGVSDRPGAAVTRARRLAARLHAGQVDKQGVGYVRHLEAVARLVERCWPEAPAAAIEAA